MKKIFVPALLLGVIVPNAVLNNDEIDKTKIFIHYVLIAGGFSVILLPETNARKAICFV